MGKSGEIPFRDLQDLEGTTLAGRFLLERMIGRGGYGAVFGAQQISVGRPCAVKVLVPHVVEQPQNVTRFEREARATSQLAHPNTIVIYDFGLDDARQLLYLAMEYIEGESLRQRIRREKRLDLESAVWITHQTASSLHDAHERGLVHRDVKPHNVMVTERAGDPNFVKVIDFGIAKFLDTEQIRQTFQRVTATGVIIGTPAYMSPEQVRNGSVDGRSDQYSLASCVYQMLTGQTVFQGESAVDIATKQLISRPPPLSELSPEIGSRLDSVLLKALEKKPERRFQTIREFSEALAEAAGVALMGTVDSGERLREEPAENETISVSLSQTNEEPVANTTQPIVAAVQELPTQSAEVAPVPVPTTQPAVERGASSVPAAGAERIAGSNVREQPVMHSVPQVAPTSTGSAASVFVAGSVVVALALSAVAIWPDGDAPEPTPPQRSPEILAVAPPVHVPEGPDPRPADSDVDAGPPVLEEKSLPPDPVIERASRPKRAAKPVKDEKPATGSVSITVVPWGNVVIDGELKGSQTHQIVELSEGKHTVELRQDGQKVLSKTVDVQRGKNTMIELIAP